MVKDLKTASVLAFERKFDVSDAVFYSGDWNRKAEADKAHKIFRPIILREKSVRGVISNRLKKGSKEEKDPLKLDAEIEKANLQTVDVATLFPEDDTLKVVFTIRVLPGVGQPSACNDHEYQKKLLETVSTFLKGGRYRRFGMALCMEYRLWPVFVA